MIDIMVSCDTIIPMTTGIYKITRKETGKAYVGMSRDIEIRWRGHVNHAMLGKGHAIHAAIKKYGADAFEFEILEQCTAEKLVEREKHHIAEQKTLAPRGYNMSSGGQSGYSDLSDEAKSRHKKVTQEMHKDPEYIKNHAEAVKRRTESDSWKEKNAEASKKTWNIPGFREAKSEYLKNRFKNDPERKARHVEMLKKRNADPEFKKVHLAAMKKLNADPEHKARMAAIIGQSHTNQTKYNFFHPVHGERFCRQIDLRKEFAEIKHANLSRLCSGRGISYKDWSILANKGESNDTNC
jgi:group I intron endonuclease